MLFIIKDRPKTGILKHFMLSFIKLVANIITLNNGFG